MRAFADLYRRLDSATSTRAKQAALAEAFVAARDDPERWGGAAWMIYFLAGGKPRQTVPTKLLRRLAVELSGLPEWLCEECYHSVGDLAETLALLTPDSSGAEEVSLDAWMRDRLLPLPALDEEERYVRLKRWVEALPSDERLVFFKLITGELRVGVSRLQVVKALAGIAGVEESRMAQRMIGYAQARRAPGPADFEALIGEVKHDEGAALDAGRAYPFYLAQSWQRPAAEMESALGPPSDWIVEWKFDGIRAQLVRRGDGWRLWSRGEELISEAYPDLAGLAFALPDNVALDGELVVMAPPAGETNPHSLAGLAPFASLQQRLGRKVISAKTLAELPVAFIAYDLLELDGQDIRAEPQWERRAKLEALASRLIGEAGEAGGRLPLRVSPAVTAPTWEAMNVIRLEARALGREGLMLKAREGAYGVGRRKGGDRADVWWKWKLDPMSVDAVLIYAQRGHGRRSASTATIRLASGPPRRGVRDASSCRSPRRTPACRTRKCARSIPSSARRRSRRSGRFAA